MKAVVIRSINDPSEQRCIDIRRHGDGSFEWLECRRDPEDPHGWRVLGGEDGFASVDDALNAARDAAPWLPADPVAGAAKR
ncbi:hypothetical protein [Actibacterium sp. 188UL27-1]|uniref:hypothetical protein n=1 Tax=Actibacterium sp. 188UL27-1 TaxID=2786961 RepID=UPI00195F11EC|nr:hypothetical protein [Actibacterium sp. 188UL27-1]MBM7068461.1 hypothetical protein [Actibacterium sp. 188UL27-1]